MPIGSFLNAFPPVFLLVVRLAAFIVGASSPRAPSARARAARLELHAVCHRRDHLYGVPPRWTVFLFAHTIAEVLDLAAFILVFVGAVQTSVARLSARAARA